MIGHKTSLFLAVLLCLAIISAAIDTINVTVPLKYGETIVSSGGNFELGFFSPGNGKNRFVGIWYKKISAFTVVWVANRDNPLNDSSGVLQFVGNRNLALFNSVNDTVWSTVSSGPMISPVAQLLDTGNFVLRDELSDPENFLWQSFDYPGDTFLPGVKYGMDLKTGFQRSLTSWRSFDDPSSGNYTNKLNPNGVPQFFLSRNSVPQFRSGSWNGLRFGGMLNLKPNPIYTFDFVANEDEIYYTYELINSSVLSRMVLSPEGVLQRFTWADRTQDWNLYLTANMDNCDRYAVCGANGICNINNSPACGCLKGFTPKSPDDWSAADWSKGCIRKVPLDCSDGEGFLKITGVKIPDTQRSWYNRIMNLKECEDECKRNCSCTAYANLDVRNGGSGCILWFGELIDIRMYNENGQDIYIRMAASVIDRYRRTPGKKRVRIIAISVSVVGLLLLSIFSFLYIRRKKRLQLRRLKTEGNAALDSEQDNVNQSNNDDLELPLFDFSTIAEATNYFSLNNKLGQGGYGPVYKGLLKDGNEIAVKRLSSNSRQGIDQFKNEVLCIAKLQHRNLVRLLGCCIQLDERMLIYEYMANKSLNFFIFDKTQSRLLDWPKRFQIINGVARGLLYLHQDSRLRIIHRDLKASNVLLDYEMNPKISDFGMARSFGGDETSANTNRIVGTYGYMSPEYAVDGLFSVKSDVFSFGVLVLEIISGKRNRGFSHADHKLNLLGHAWVLHKEGRSTQLIDQSIKESCIESEVLRSIHISLLCVQQNPEDRPTMSTVVLMFNSDIALPQPKEPGFFTERDLLERYSSTDNYETSSNNGVTLTLLEAR